MSTPVSHHLLPGSGVRLHVAQLGEGDPVILLHGFPEHWISWRRQMRALSEAGFGPWAPDLRGYNESERPRGREAYRLEVLVEDIAEMVRGLGKGKIHLVGHDWGGIIAWTLASVHPELVRRLVILNAPHMGVYFRKLWPRQAGRSWYALFFQLPLLPEWLLGARRCAMVRRMLLWQTTPGTFNEEDLAAYAAALGKAGALTAAVNYYRANFRGRWRRAAETARTEAPTLVIWGERDVALGVELLDGLEVFAPRVRIHRIATAGHWVQNEAADEVNRVLISFLKEAPGDAA